MSNKQKDKISVLFTSDEAKELTLCLEDLIENREWDDNWIKFFRKIKNRLQGETDEKKGII